MRQMNLWLVEARVYIKALLHLSLLTPLIYVYLAVSLLWWGGDPVEPIIHYFANTALNLLLLLLLLAPLSRYLRLTALLRYRRLLGLYVAFYALLHVLAFMVFDLASNWGLFAAELLNRPYMLPGMLVLLLLIAMSISSFKAIQMKMGKRWLQLHGCIFPACLLVVVHLWWAQKSGNIEGLLYLSAFLLLLGLRFKQVRSWWRSFFV